MAFNSSVFKTRALTAIIFVTVMLAGLLINSWTFLALFTIIHFGCWGEFHRLMGKIDTRYATVDSNLKWSGSLIGFGFMLWNTELLHVGQLALKQFGLWVMICGALFFFIALLFEKNYKKGLLQYTFLSLIYISLSWGLLIDISKWSIDGYPTIVLALIVSIWLNDTLAYLVGSFIGKTPFSKISPKKTWEGTVGGAILAVVIVTLVGRYCVANALSGGGPDSGNIQTYFTRMCLSVSIAGAVIGTLGDLLESKIKRMADVKDCGSIMPGHGGFLDRFDSLLLATPAVWIIIRISMHL